MDFTADELIKFRGENGTPLYISVKGKVYDCTEAADFYGPGKPYAVFAGRDVTRCLAKMLISDEEANAGWQNLSYEHTETLNEWVTKYEEKYPVVGTFRPSVDFIERGAAMAP